MMNESKKRFERGQSLVIVTMSLVVFLAFLALALDGGYAWAQRRNAQTAADAGALAGARLACQTDISWETAVSVASQYAVTENGATSIDTPVKIFNAAGTQVVGMEVTAHVVFNTFFAHLIGRPTIDAQAVARAQCFPPGEVVGVLPVGWSCRPNLPVAGGEQPDDDEDNGCIGLNPITYDEWLEYKLDPSAHLDDLYMIMDSNKTNEEVTCKDPEDPLSTGLDCDLDDDGRNDVFGGGDRSFLNLDGGSSGMNEIVEWIETRNTPGIRIHSWIPNTSGNKVPAYSAVKDPETGMINTIVTVPIFDALCKSNSMYDEDCLDQLEHPWIDPPIDVTDLVITGTGENSYAHVTAFAGFAITCVNSPGNPKMECPAWEAFADQPGNNGVQSYVSIEGFFVGAFITGSGSILPGGSIDPETFVVKLIR